MSNISRTILQNETQSVCVTVPHEQLLDQSLYITAPNKQFHQWSEQDHSISYLFMQQIAQAWNSNNITDQYLVYGKVDANNFLWEMVPYQKCQTIFGRIFQQLQVLWRTVFGGKTVSEETAQEQAKQYTSLLEKAPRVVIPLETTQKSTDSFCKEQTIERQWVITGKKVHVLFNYAPIGFGGERLHFLVVPKEHRQSFTEVTQEEYSESLSLTTKLITHLKQTRPALTNVYLLNKTGVDAGQTVPHWHLHVICSTHPVQDFWGKITVIKNILLGSSPMKHDDLVKRVASLRQELAPL